MDIEIYETRDAPAGPQLLSGRWTDIKGRKHDHIFILYTNEVPDKDLNIQHKAKKHSKRCYGCEKPVKLVRPWNND